MITICKQGPLPALCGFKGADKVTHFIYGALAAAGAAGVATLAHIPPVTAALVVGGLVAVGKEIADYKLRGKTSNPVNAQDSILDFLATIAGAIAVAYAITKFM